MVHRPPDSRLLSNLITHEKEYSKHLAALFPLSHIALASLSAYTATCPSPRPYSTTSSPPAQSLATILDVLASADDALQRYNQAMEVWREQLVHLKDLEDDVTAVLRDREILVTRLIKASNKSQKSSRDARSSLLINANTGSTSFTSLPSTNSTTAGSATSKLAHAQAELQACEAHLAAKEQELEVSRTSVVRDGLGARCRALIDCGWVWSEMGKEGLRALQALNTPTNDIHGQSPELKSFPRTQSPSPPPSSGLQKPLPLPASSPHIGQGPTSHSSDISLTPSQSVSQITGPSVETSQETHRDFSESSRMVQKSQDEHQANVTITVPPAHAISEFTLPTGVSSRSLTNGHATEFKQDVSGSGSTRRRHRQPGQPGRQGRPLSRRIVEVSDEDENVTIPPIVSAGSNFLTDFPIEPARSDESSDEDVTQGPLEIVENQPFGQARPFSIRPVGTEVDVSPGKRRDRKSSMAFFGSLRGLFKHKGKDRELAEWEKSPPPSPLGKKSKGGWVTRTDTRLKGQRGRDSSDSERDATPRAPATLGSAKLRKGRTAGSPEPSPTFDRQNGWLTDGPSTVRSRGSVKRKKKAVAEWRARDAGHTDGELDRADDAIPGRLSQTTRKSSEIVNPRERPSLQRLPSTTSVPNRLSRTSSLSRGSIMSAPAATSSLNRSDSHSLPISKTLSHTHAGEEQSAFFKTKSKPRQNGKLGAPQVRHSINGSGGKSLMSIVEDVTRQNREGRGAASGSLLPNGDGLPLRTISSSGSRPAILQVPITDGKQSRSLDLPRAPSSVIPASQSLSMSAHGRTSSSPLSQIGSSTTPTLANGSASRPVKSPLRSALRSSSRTPSPRPTQQSTETRGRQARAHNEDIQRRRDRTPERELPSPRDSASISSYVTGRESPEPELPVPPSPPPRDQAETPSNVSTETPPVRRKSVRVSLQPTFSPTPPALYENDDDVNGMYAPWSVAPSKEGWNMRNGSSGDGGRGIDVWQDSSEEDEEYSRAKRLLSRVGKKSNKG